MEVFGEVALTQEQMESLRTPCYIVNEARVEENLKLLLRVQDEAGCKILLALKGFAMWSLFPLARKYLKGVAASSVNEARLGKEEFGGEVHAYAPAYSEEEVKELTKYASHISFNSAGQYGRYRKMVTGSGRRIECAVRINPEHSEVKVRLYDPCAPCSSLGMTERNFREAAEAGKLEGLSGLHFHSLCELGSDALERTLAVVEKKFGFFFPEIKWINFGGGHHVTRPGYDVERLVRIIKDFRSRYPQLEVYLEPGEAIALNTGVLVSTVLDLTRNKMDIAVLDTSAEAHMPDVLAMPYRPHVLGADLPGKKKHTYRLGGNTCLSGDVIGDYSFDRPLSVGQKLVFGDMAHYTMVKNTTFNGVNLPSICIFNSKTRKLRLVKRFGYGDYKGRLS